MGLLEGSLAIVSFPGLVQLLSGERRTGRLLITPEGEDQGPRGVIWLSDGAIVHAECADAARGAEGLPAALALAAAERGNFQFEPGPEAPRRTLTVGTEQVLLEAACQKDHARRDAGARREGGVAGEAIPRFAPVATGDSTPSFDTVQWRILAAIDGGKDVSALAAEVGLPMEAVARIVSDLVAARVLQVG